MRVPFVDDFLNSITMYRLVLYGLIVLVVISLLFGAFAVLPFTFPQLVSVLLLCLATCYLANLIFARIFKATTNDESYLITALILFFILAPSLKTDDLIIVFVASVLAVGSKFLLAVDKKHIFNPAGISIFIISLFGFGNIIWWVGSTVLLPFVIVLGFLVVRKLRKFEMVTMFFAVALSMICMFNLRNGLTFEQSFVQAFTSWPIVFFATIMLTEPLTLPPTKRLQVLYGAFVGLFFGLQFHIGPLFASPEFALVVGNVFSYLVGSKQKLFAKLQFKQEVGQNMYEFAFSKLKGFRYLPGQYLEWTLKDVNLDSRGNRRYFTLASSPTEENVLLGVKISPEESSNYKKKMLLLEEGEEIIGAQLSGDFTLPEDKKKKLVFVAGGIGVTPFRSMVKYLIDKNEKRDMVLFYCASDPREFVYKDIFASGAEIGLKTVYVVTGKENIAGWSGEAGRITPEMLEKYVPDYRERKFYISGPNAMVEGYKKLLHTLSVGRENIVTDYFPGF